MGKLYLVRHGQASFMAENYDQLSALGARQASALGKYWGDTGQQFDRVMVGPLARQRDTEQHLRSALQAAGGQLPEAELHDDLREHAGAIAFTDSLPRLATEDSKMGQLARVALTNGNSKRDRLRAFDLYVTLWATGQLPADEFESFQAFLERMEILIAEIVAAASSGATFLAVTSGGVIAAAVGLALKTAPADIMRLNGAVYNGSYHEFRFRSQEPSSRLSLIQFNAIPHLGPELQSQI